MGGANSSYVHDKGQTDQTEGTDQATGEELVKPLYKNGRFKNPFDTYEDVTFMGFIRFMRSQDNSGIPWNDTRELDTNLPIIKPDFEKLNSPPENNVQLMWIGHASVLVQFDGLTVLTDPVFGKRCGPLGVFGPKRYRNPPCTVDELPEVDAVVISHNHYDHLEHDAVVKLNNKFGDNLTWYVAEGGAGWMRARGCRNVVEITWWQENTHVKDGKEFTFVSTPSQHSCQRTATDANKALWCSWVVKGPMHSFYFAGDTGYCNAFKQIGRKYGPFSLSAIPIGAYEPRGFMRPMHVNPEEAVMLHEDVTSQRSLGIHWGTFRLTHEHYMEPKQKLSDVLKERGYPDRVFFTSKHGEVVSLDDDT